MNALLAPLVAIVVTNQPPQFEGPEGYWLNPAASAIVEITSCGTEVYCGEVRWASDKASADAAKAGTNQLVGSRLFENLVKTGRRSWKGRVFIPDRGRSYPAEVRLTGAGQLRITGCAVRPLLCKSQPWTRTVAPSPIRPSSVSGQSETGGRRP